MTARTLALRILAGVLVFISITGAIAYVTLTRSHEAEQTGQSAERKAVEVDREAFRLAVIVRDNQIIVRTNRRLIETNVRLTRTNRRLAITNRRLIADTRKFLVRRGLARRTIGGELAAPGAMGRRGDPGRDAPVITSDQVRAIVAPMVAAAVAASCGETCKGPQGRDGTDGTDGLDALPVTDEQRAADVAAYCAGPNQPCKGDPGQSIPGPDGPPGPPGPAGEPGAPAPPMACDESLGYVCQPPAPPAP